MEVRVVNVRKEFERFPALHDVSLDIRSGELIALLGPSGSGKTTLLRLIAGLERPTKGAIFFGDEDASQKSIQERNVGFVFQHYALFRHMTVVDNIGFGLKVRVGVMSQGRIEQVGTADDIYDTPNSPFVYSFIGESSSLPVKVDNGEVWIADRPIGLQAPHVPSGEAQLYFRPHDVELLDGCS